MLSLQQNLKINKWLERSGMLEKQTRVSLLLEFSGIQVYFFFGLLATRKVFPHISLMLAGSMLLITWMLVIFLLPTMKRIALVQPYINKKPPAGNG